VELAAFRAASSFESIEFSADGQRLIAHSSPLSAWDLATGFPVVGEDTVAPGRPSIAPGLIGAWDAVSADRALHATATCEQVFVRDAAGRAVIRLPLPPWKASNSAHAADMREKLVKFHSVEAASVAIAPGSDLLAVGRQNGSLHVIDLKNADNVATMQRHFGPVYTLAFSPDGRRLASGGNDGTIRLWDTTSFEQVGVLTGHQSYVRALAFRPDGKQLATASGDGTVRLWDTEPVRIRGDKKSANQECFRVIAPRVRRRLQKLGSAQRVADELRGDTHLSDVDRRAALRVLLTITPRPAPAPPIRR
jgi:WD40 repeat protein